MHLDMIGGPIDTSISCRCDMDFEVKIRATVRLMYFAIIATANDNYNNCTDFTTYLGNFLNFVALLEASSSGID